MREPHRLRPTDWPAPPSTFSHSSLSNIEECPRRWQLVRARFGEHRFPERPSRAAIAGRMVHELLDELFKAVALRGAPPLASEAFRALVRDFDLRARARSRVERQRVEWRAHPRARGWDVGLSIDAIVSQVITLFRTQYRASLGSVVVTERIPERAFDVRQLAELVQRHPLTEVRLEHPQLPFEGTIDLVHAEEDGLVVLDFKTGTPKPAHREQVERYGVLWWRATGIVPVRLVLAYPSCAESFACDRATLERVEADLRARCDAARAQLTQHPASARPGDHCRYCSHRAFCDDAWSEEKLEAEGRVDLEVVVDGVAQLHGFAARTRAGRSLQVVHDAGTLSPRTGDCLRILDARWFPARRELAVDGLSEVFCVDGSRDDDPREGPPKGARRSKGAAR